LARFSLRRVWRRWLPLLLAIALVPALGCASAEVPGRSQLVFASPSDPTTFNAPLNDSLYSRAVLGLINEGMVGVDGVTGDLVPALAESWEVSDDNLRVIFTLRDGLRWSDGEPLTAEDVVFTYNDVYLNEAIPTGTRDILRVGASGAFPQVRALDERRVEFTVPEPFAPFVRFTGGISILPKHALIDAATSTNANGDVEFLSTWSTDTDPSEIVGAGMYRLSDYVAAQRAIVTRNPYYWRTDEEGEELPKIDRVIIQVIESDDGQLIAFRSGDLDNLDVKPEQFRLLKREEDRGRYTIYNGGPENGSRLISFNLNKARSQDGEPFVDPVVQNWFHTLAFRQAVAYAVDRDRMRNTTYRGLGEIQHSPIWQQSPFYLSPQEGLKTYDYDPARAKELLTGAGFKYNSAGELEDADGNRVRFTMLVKSEEKTRVDAAVQIQQDLEAIGMRVDLQVLQFNAVLQKLDRRDWEVYVGGFGGGSLDPHSGFNIWFSGGALHQFNQGPIPGQPPIEGWEVSDWEREIDRLFAEGVRELDEAKRKEIYGRFQQIIAEQVPFIYLVNQLSFSAVRDRIENVEYTALGGAFWNLYELEIEPN